MEKLAKYLLTDSAKRANQESRRQRMLILIVLVVALIIAPQLTKGVLMLGAGLSLLGLTALFL